MAEDVEKRPARKRGKKKGSPKTGGRQKGTPNRNSLSVLGALDRANVPVIEFLVMDIQCLEPEARVQKWFQLLGYCYPRLKMIEFIPHAPSGAKTAEVAAPPESAASAPASKDDRFNLIRGHKQGKPATSE